MKDGLKSIENCFRSNTNWKKNCWKKRL